MKPDQFSLGVSASLIHPKCQSRLEHKSEGKLCGNCISRMGLYIIEHKEFSW